MVQVKVKRGKKRTVLDDLKIYPKNSLYCLLFYQNKDSKGGAVYKLGMTTDFENNRLSSYHTNSGNTGFYVVAFLEKITRPRKTEVQRLTNDIVRTAAETKSWIRKYVYEAETFLFSQMKLVGAKRIHSTTHIRNNDGELREDMAGTTEQWYATEAQIFKAFENTADKYTTGTLQLYHIEDIEKDKKEFEKKALYIGEVVYLK